MRAVTLGDRESAVVKPYLTYEQKENNIVLQVKQMLLDGEFKPTQAQLIDDYHLKFFEHYNLLMERLKMPSVPILYDELLGMFKLLPSFAKVAKPNELKAFRAILEKRFEQSYRDDFTTGFEAETTEVDRLEAFYENQEDGSEEEFDDAAFDEYEEGDEEYDGEEYGEGDDEDTFEGRYDFEECDMPDLPYRADNQVYIDGVFQELMGLPNGNPENEERFISAGPVTDNLGMIENRKNLLMNRLSAACYQYMLPKFAVAFDENDKPYFLASEKEIATMQTILQARAKEHDKVNAIGAEYGDLNRLQESDDPEDQQKHKDGQYEMNVRMQNLQRQQWTTWAHQNKSFAFPSEISMYTHELIQGYGANLKLADGDGGRENILRYVEIAGYKEKIYEDEKGIERHKGTVTFPVDRPMPN